MHISRLRQTRSHFYIHSCLSCACRNVSKNHSYLSCWLNLHLTKVRPYSASKHYDQGMPSCSYSRHCLFGSTLALLLALACRNVSSGRRCVLQGALSSRLLGGIPSSSQPPSFLLVSLFRTPNGTNLDNDSLLLLKFSAKALQLHR